MLTMEELLANELGLDVIAHLPGGEHGALAVEASDGASLVLKVFSLAEPRPTLRRARDTASDDWST